MARLLSLVACLLILLHPASPVGAANLGPSRGGLAFVSVAPDGTRQIALVSIAGGRLRWLTRAPGHNESPAWSPDGRHLAYVRDHEGDAQIYVLDVNRGTVRRVTGRPRSHHSPTWSPDGRRIVYVEDAGATMQILMTPTDGAGRKQLTAGPRSNFAPVWSPNGREIAFLSRARGREPELFLMNTDGSRRRPVPTRTTGVIPVVSSVVWMPDGRHLLYTSRAGRASDEIALVRRDGSSHRWISSGYAPSPAPDGRRVAFVVSRVGSAQIYVSTVNVGSAQPLTKHEFISLRPAWSPDGRTIAYLSIGKEDELALWVMHPDGGGKRRLAAAAGNFSRLPVLAWYR